MSSVLILRPRLDTSQLPPSLPQVSVDSVPLGQHEGSTHTVTGYVIRRIGETIVQLDPDAEKAPR